MLCVPEKILDQHVIVLGKTGSGKSSKMRVLTEHLLDQDEAPIIIDPKGDWWGLKSSADGKREGFPLVIFGGNHADVPLNPRAGAELAELLATGRRAALIDMRGWMPGDRTRFFIDFAAALFKHTRGKRWLIVDEVHNFAPKGKIMDPDAGRMLHWANRLASEGRGLGLNIIAASQRPQKVHNDFLTSCETLIAARVIHKADRDAIKDWVDGCADPAAGKLMLGELANMKRTDAWVWSPEIEFGPQRITFPLFRTYDSFKPQPAGQEKLKGWAEVDLDDVRTKLAAVVEEAQRNDPAALRKQIAELERQLKAKVTTPAPNGALVEAHDAIRRDADIIKRQQSAIVMARRTFAEILAWHDKHTAAVANLIRATEANFDSATLDAAPAAAYVSIHPQKGVKPATRSALVSAATTLARPKSSGNGAVVDLPKGETAILRACIQFPEGLQREQFSVLTGYKRSSRDTYIQRLRERGLVEISGELVKATGDGVAAIPDAEPLPTGDALQDYWRRELPEGERKILDELIRAYPKAIARSDLDEATGYQRSSRDTYLQRLRAKYLIEEPSRGEVQASARLFT